MKGIACISVDNDDKEIPVEISFNHHGGNVISAARTVCSKGERMSMPPSYAHSVYHNSVKLDLNTIDRLIYVFE